MWHRFFFHIKSVFKYFKDFHIFKIIWNFETKVLSIQWLTDGFCRLFPISGRVAQVFFSSPRRILWAPLTRGTRRVFFIVMKRNPFPYFVFVLLSIIGFPFLGRELFRVFLMMPVPQIPVARFVFFVRITFIRYSFPLVQFWVNSFVNRSCRAGTAKVVLPSINGIISMWLILWRISLTWRIEIIVFSGIVVFFWTGMNLERSLSGLVLQSRKASGMAQ